MNRLQHHRSLTTGNRPTTSDEGLYEGSLWINFPDKQLGTVDDGNNVVDFLPIRFFSATADYAVGDLVVNQAKLWRALNAVTAAAWDATDWEEICGSSALFRTVQSFTGLPVGSTEITWAHDPAQVELYMNGSRLISGTDYTADGTKFTLTNPITSATDVFVGVTYQTVPIANAITQVAADARYAQFKDVSVSPFEAAKAYNQNDLVSQNGDVWSAIGAVTPGPWDANDWRISRKRTSC